MPNYYSKITPQGAAKMMAATLADKLDLTQFAVGFDGADTQYADNTEFPTDFTPYQHYKGAISKDRIRPGYTHQRELRLNIPGTEGGWDINRVAIFDADDDIIFFGAFDTVAVPAAGANSTRFIVLDMIIELINTVDPAVLTFSLSQNDDHSHAITDVEGLAQALSDLETHEISDNTGLVEALDAIRARLSKLESGVVSVIPDNSGNSGTTTPTVILTNPTASLGGGSGGLTLGGPTESVDQNIALPSVTSPLGAGKYSNGELTITWTASDVHRVVAIATEIDNSQREITRAVSNGGTSCTLTGLPSGEGCTIWMQAYGTDGRHIGTFGPQPIFAYPE